MQTTFLWLVSDVCVTTINLPVFGREQEARNFLLCSWVTACLSWAATAAVKLNSDSTLNSCLTKTHRSLIIWVCIGEQQHIFYDKCFMQRKWSSSTRLPPLSNRQNKALYFHPSRPSRADGWLPGQTGQLPKRGSHSVNFHERPKIKKKQFPPFWDRNQHQRGSSHPECDDLNISACRKVHISVRTLPPGTEISSTVVDSFS